jgi:hypothetical protein
MGEKKPSATGTEWTVRSRYETTDGDRVTLLYWHDARDVKNDRFAVSYSYNWPHAPQFIEYTNRSNAIRAFVASLNSAERRGVVAHREG